MRSPMSTFSIKGRLDDLSEEIADVSGATAFSCEAPMGWLRRYGKELEPDRGQGQKEWRLDFQPRWWLEH